MVNFIKLRRMLTVYVIFYCCLLFNNFIIAFRISYKLPSYGFARVNHDSSRQRSSPFPSFTSSSLFMVEQRDIAMPALSSTMKEGKIVSWQKKIGDKVKEGDILLVVESDKADMDVESFDDGYLAAIYTPDGGTASVGSTVCSLVKDKADINKVKGPATASSSSATSSSSSSASSAASSSKQVGHTTSSPPASSASSGAKPDFETILMPALSSTMKEGKIVSWSKKIGDKINVGDMVLVVESDKADMDVESYEEGYLASIAVNEGEIAAVSSPVGYLAKKKDAINDIQAYIASGGGKVSFTDSSVSSSATSSQKKEDASSSSSSSTASSAPAIINEGRISSSGYAKQVAKEQGIDLRTVKPLRSDSYIVSKDLDGIPSTIEYQSSSSDVINATPTAKKLAQENNLEIKSIKGSGNFGRVLVDDVLKAAGKYVAPVVSSASAAVAVTAAKSQSETKKEPSSKSASASSTTGTAVGLTKDETTEMNAMQKAVVKNMEATLSIPVFRISKEICTDKLDELYSQLKVKGVTLSAMLAKAVAIAAMKHPLINAGYKDGKIFYHKDINVAMAVAIDGGLITPVLQKCQDLDLFSIGRNWKDLVERAKGKKLSPQEYTSG
jgi:pyruvate dehydrogenase E2 component (dihydrolipoamide acetyltransferase)